MRVKFRYGRRHQTYVTLCACGAALALMVVRFGLSLETLLSFFIITVILFAVMLILALALGLVLKKFRDKRQSSLLKELEAASQNDENLKE